MQKWIITQVDGETEEWIADEVDFNLANAFGFFTASSGISGRKSSQYKQFQNMMGFSLETIDIFTKGEKTIITLTNIKKGYVGAPFSPEGYEILNTSNPVGILGR